MKKYLVFTILISTYSCLSSANRYIENDVSPSILRNSTGSDDTAFVVMVTIALFGSIVINYLSTQKKEPSFMKIILFVLTCLAIFYIWAKNN